MRHLVDTNVWLQPMLGQVDAAECDAYLTVPRADVLVISAFALHSVGIVCVKRKLYDEYDNFVAGVRTSGLVEVIALTSADLPQVTDAARQYGLDLDDAYQYVVAETHNFQIVSCDNDFAKAPGGYLRPRDAMPPQNGQQP